MTPPTQLEAMYDHEARRRDTIWLTQPIGGGRLVELTFGQAMDQARRMATHLGSLGLPPRSQIALFSKNCAWWFLADLAIWLAGHVSVPLYPTLAADTIAQILDHSEARLLFVGKLDDFAAMAPGIPEGLPRIALPLGPAIDAPKWDDLIAQHEPLAGRPSRGPDELATLIYTSGSTGVPKGVMHSFATMCGARGFIEELGLTAADRVLSYLPLAHALERSVVETLGFLVGHHIYFAESLETFVADLRRARPTIFVSVPRLWLKFQQGVFAKMPPKKLALLLMIPIVNGIVRKKILTGLGLEHVRVAATGSAPIPAELLDWYHGLGLELLEGYGMSENFSYSHLTRPGEIKVGTVGRPHDEVQQRLNAEGELEVKSPCTMLGYFKAPELTAEVMTADGFLRTGDRGELDAEGRLTITGRVKDLFKTSKGKYVSPSPIENALMAHPEIELACVAGAGQPQPFAMVVLSPVGRAVTDRAALEATLAGYVAALNARLDPHEQLDTLVVVSDPWTIENGLLTPTMKLRRTAVEQRYAAQVAGWYAAGKPVVWA